MERYFWRFGVSILALAAFGPAAASGAEQSDRAAFQALIEDDWSAQERRLGRGDDQPAAIRDVLARAERLLDVLARRDDAPDLGREAAALAELRPAASRAELLDEAARRSLYRRVRGVARQLAFKNPLLADRPILFLKQRRFICQMIHEYVGYYYDYTGIHGGDVCVLEEPGRSMRVRSLVDGRLPRGNYTTLALSYDGRKAYFSFAELPQRERPELQGNWLALSADERGRQGYGFYEADRSAFHIYAIDTQSGELQRLTSGPEDDFSPCPLPSGDVAFLSSRRGGFCRCNNPFEPLPTYTLHRMDAAGENLRTISYHETNEWHPAVLNDGRIVYSRWDYVDRSAAHFHGLWVTNPDGGNPKALFGNYTMNVSACFQPAAIPGSNRIAFIAGAHHSPVGGTLVLFDPARAAYDPQTGEDRFESLEILTPEVCLPEAPGWPSSYYHGPWPLSEDFYLIGFSFQPLPGWGPRVVDETEIGLYYFDRFGNLEMLYREPGLSCTSPIPLGPRPAPLELPPQSNPQLGDEGEFVLTDAAWSFLPQDNPRPIRELRVYQVLPKVENHVVNRPRLGHANAESARMYLGSVPVESDGSAYFRAPAGKPLYFQAVDAQGRAVQTMRSITYLQPGEQRGCVGCHEPPNVTPRAKPPLAIAREPSAIQPGPDGTQPFNYVRLMQPMLDRHCLDCHDGAEGPGKSALDLRGEPEGEFTRSYANLRPFLRWYEWGGESIAQIVTSPGHCGADESPLSRILDDQTHRKALKLTDAERRQIYLWLDSNVPFYGVYADDQRLAQLRGERVPPPTVQ
mgnify:CR=1 FL=1